MYSREDRLESVAAILVILMMVVLVFYVAVRDEKIRAEKYAEELENKLSVYVALDEWEFRQMIATGYAPLDPKAIEGVCHDGSPTSTSTGSYPSRGTIAVNPEVIHYGTILLVEGYGPGIALDTGGAIRAATNKIDLFFDTIEEALQWGVRTVWVAIKK